MSYKPSETLDVKSFGAVGDGVTDDYAAITAAIAACPNGGIIAIPTGTYLVNTSINLNKWINISGLGVGVAIKAGAALSSILNISVGGCTIRDLTFDGNANANYDVYLTQGQATQFNNCTFSNAIIDGLHCPSSGNQDFAHFQNCTFISNGTTYRTTTALHPAATNACRKVAILGTVATTASSAIITGIGTSFNSYGIRKGDIIAIGTTSTEYLTIVSVDSDTQLTIEALPGAGATRSGQDFALCIGDGYHEEKWIDNNIISHSNCLYRSNAGNGARIAGLYGTRLMQPFVETNGGFGISIGTQGGLDYVLGCSITDLYSEGNYAPAAVHCGHVFGLTITNVLCELPVVAVSNANYVSGTVCGDVLHDGGVHRTKVVGSALNEVPVTQLNAGVNFGGYQVNPFSYVPASVSSGIISSSINPPSYAAVVYPDVGEVGGLVTAIPSLVDGVVDGQEYTIKGSWAGRPIILQDDSILSGSKLHLKTPYTYLDPQGYLRLRWTNGAWYEQWRSPLVSDGSVLGSPVHDSTGTPGDATQHAVKGRVALAAGTAVLTVTNSKVTATSIITAILQTVDATCQYIQAVVPTSGSFTIQFNANATAPTNVAWKLEE